MILIEMSPKELFQKRLAILEVSDSYFTLTFDEPFVKGRNRFKKDDFVSKEYMTVGEISYMKKELGIKVLPYEIFNEFKLEDVYMFLRTL